MILTQKDAVISQSPLIMNINEFSFWGFIILLSLLLLGCLTWDVNGYNAAPPTPTQELLSKIQNCVGYKGGEILVTTSPVGVACASTTTPSTTFADFQDCINGLPIEE